jgi:dienelactone hydrolase
MKLRKLLLALAIGLWSFGQPLASASAKSGVMDIGEAARLFGERPSAFAPDLSPNGDKVVYLAAGPAAITVVHILDLTTKTDSPLVKSTGKPEQLEWCNFADERWVVCRFGGWMKLLGLTMPIARTVAVDTMTGKVRSLGAAENSVEGGFEQFDGEVLDWLPDEQGSLVMQRRYAAHDGNPGSVGVDHIRIDPFRVKAVEPAMARDFDYMTDGHGTVRLRSEAKSDLDDLFTGESTYEYRAVGSSKWLALPEGGKDFTPLAIEKQSDSLYFLKPLNGRDALFRIKLDGSASESLVASNPDVDIGSVIELGPGQPVIGYRYTDDRTHTVYVDPAAKKLGDGLAKALPGLPLINFVGSSKNGQKLLIHAGSDTDPGVYFVLDRQTNQMDPVLNSSDAIDGSELAPMKPVLVPTADGKSIPAYLTVRADLGTGPRPAIVLPHGGPTARDTWQFDWIAQFLAARGYAVIQPNFRGSAGYGKAFLGENAFHDWRQVMSDIRDSADWLVKQGVADPNRVAIVGWSYGGYAALESAAMDPRYKAVVAIAPVTDLKQLRRDSRGFRNEAIEKEEIGKGDQLVDGSPINRAGDIHAPVLMVHGTLDGNVDYDHSKRMLAALKRAGGNADLLTFEGLDHQLDDWDARRQMLTRIGELLERTIGH